MTDREKLIELIANLLRNELGDNFVFTREYAKYGGYSGYKEHYVYDIAKKIADNLIANDMVIRKKGEWVLKNGEYCCDQCGYTNTKIKGQEMFICDGEKWISLDRTAQCPRCGADMRGEQNE